MEAATRWCNRPTGVPFGGKLREAMTQSLRITVDSYACSVVVPDHAMLGQNGKVLEVPCLGPQAPAYGTGPRRAWETSWSVRHPGRPTAKILDGRGVRYLGRR
jgi:hypothetical protein